MFGEMDIRTEDREDLEEMERECEEAIAALKEQMDPMKEKLEVIHLSPLKKSCSVKTVGVVWMPYRVDPELQLESAW